MAMSQATGDDTPWVEAKQDADTLAFVLGGAWVTQRIGKQAAVLDTAPQPGARRISLDIAAVASMDTAGAWLVYKTINTMDSMIGYKTERHAAFGMATARLDDAVNYIPARIAGLFIVAAAMFVPKGLSSQALSVMLRDGAKHRSPNAGWPEAAMAGALGVALSGPRRYDGKTVDEPWLGEEFSARIGPAEINRALYLFVVACLINAVVIAAVVTFLIA